MKTQLTLIQRLVTTIVVIIAAAATALRPVESDTDFTARW